MKVPPNMALIESPSCNTAQFRIIFAPLTNELSAFTVPIKLSPKSHKVFCPGNAIENVASPAIHPPLNLRIVALKTVSERACEKSLPEIASNTPIIKRLIFIFRELSINCRHPTLMSIIPAVVSTLVYLTIILELVIFFPLLSSTI